MSWSEAIFCVLLCAILISYKILYYWSDVAPQMARNKLCKHVEEPFNLCPICRSYESDQRLSCSHSVCSYCIVYQMSFNKWGCSFRCPLCRLESQTAEVKPLFNGWTGLRMFIFRWWLPLLFSSWSEFGFTYPWWISEIWTGFKMLIFRWWLPSILFLINLGISPTTGESESPVTGSSQNTTEDSGDLFIILPRSSFHSCSLPYFFPISIPPLILPYVRQILLNKEPDSYGLYIMLVA